MTTTATNTPSSPSPVAWDFVIQQLRSVVAYFKSIQLFSLFDVPINAYDLFISLFVMSFILLLILNDDGDEED